jgi:hypothetical protein
MVYNWPPESDRYRRVARFVDALFDKIDRLQSSPRHPKWKDTVISASVVGLERFKPAQDWLDRYWIHNPPIENTNGKNGSPQDSAKLYNDFLRWRDGKR